MKTNFYTIVFVLLVNLIYSQNKGDYRTIASGNWEDSTKWQTYNGTTWVATTEYPGQTLGSYTVTIEEINTSTPHVITIPVASTYSIGNLVVKGQLTLNANLTLPTTSSLIIDAGTVLLNDNKVDLTLQANAQVNIINTGSGTCSGGSGINGYGIISSHCNNNNSLIIGTITYSNCAGEGNSFAGDFCDVNQSGGTINATPTSSPSSLCYNSSQNNSVILTAPDNSNIILTKTYTWYLDSPPTNFSGFSTQNTQSLKVNNLIPGNYTFRLKISITKSGNTYTSEGTVNVTVYQPTTPGTINSLNICSKYNTGNTLTLSGHFGSIVKWQSSTASDFSSNVTDIANTQNTLLLPDKLTTEMYYRAVLSNGSCSGFSAVASIKSLSTTYNGSGWSNGLPDTTKKAIFTNNYAFQNNITACSAEISNNAIVTIPEGKNFTINNELEVNSGNLIVESDANLVQINNDAQNIGNITVKRKAKMKRLDYTYWSSPVSGQNLKNFSSSTLDTRFYVYNEGNDYFDGVFNYSSYPGFTVANAFPLQNKTTYNFETAKGYAIRAPNNYSTSEQTVDWTFTGVPNNGSQSIAVKKSTNGYNLVGNPYPSSIRFSSLKALNGFLDYPVYFWNNSYANPPQQQGSSYTQENYAILTASGGVKSTNGTQKPSDTISVGQGFIVAVNANANLVFNNSIRLAAKGQFFNMRKANSEVNRFWINFKTPANNNSEILIAYIEGATNDYDKDYDATLFTNTSDKIYSIQNDKELAIQGRSPNFTATDKVSLGVAFFEPGNYEISIAQVEGIFNGSQAIYLRDKNLNTTVNLSERAYQFFANAGETKDRFEIVYKPDSTLGTDNISKNQETLIYENNGSIFIENKANKIAEIQIFDAGGRLLNISKPNDHKFSIEKSKFDKGLLIFKINLKDKATTKKFLLK